MPNSSIIWLMDKDLKQCYWTQKLWHILAYRQRVWPLGFSTFLARQYRGSQTDFDAKWLLSTLPSYRSFSGNKRRVGRYGYFDEHSQSLFWQHVNVAYSPISSGYVENESTWVAFCAELLTALIGYKGSQYKFGKKNAGCLSWAIWMDPHDILWISWLEVKNKFPIALGEPLCGDD